MYFHAGFRLNFTVYNQTKSAIQISGITSTNPKFIIIGSTNFNVGAGDSAKVNVRYAPTAAVSDTGAFTVSFAGFPSDIISVSGTGIPPAAIIGVTPAALNFGNVPLTKLADLIVDVSNSGILDLNVTQIGVTNPNFSVSGGPAFALRANETRAFAVRFAASTLGSQTDTLKVFSNDSKNNLVRIPLSAIGVTSQLPEISVQPLQLQFDEVEVKQTKTLTLKIYNRGSTNLAISKINSNNARFIITAVTKTMLLPDDSSTVSIQFNPLVAGLQTGALTITSNDLNEKILSLRMSGIGKPAPTNNNPVPLLTAKLTPANGKRLQTFDVGFKGANFIAGVTSVNPGPNITVNRVTVHRPDSLTAKLTIAANAATGVRNFSVSNSPPGGGVSGNRQFWVNNPTPTLVSLAPNNGLPGQTLSVTLTGTKFISGVTTVNAGAGIIVNSTTVNNSTSMTVKMTIAANDAGGPRNFSVTNAGPGGGTSESQSFMVKSAPTLISIAPLAGKRGQTLNVNFKGTNFVSGETSINAGAGIKVNSITVTSASSLTANLTISAAAGTGSRPFSVTNTGPNGGTSGSLNFTVENPLPTLMSITPNSGRRLQNLNIGFKGMNFFNGATKIYIGRHNVIVNSVTVHRFDSLTANITIEADATLGVRKFFVVNNPPGGGTSNGQTFTVNAPAPALLFPAPSQIVQLSKSVPPLKFVWRQTLDRDEADSLKHVFTLQGAGVDTTVVTAKDTSLWLPIMPLLKADSEYSWSVNIFDGAIAVTAPARATFRTSSTITSVQDDNALVPDKFLLEQNYPNPFALAAKSAETTIKYQLPKSNFVSLKVFDMLGREMIALVNAPQAPGYYNVSWNGRNAAGQFVPGGVYLCRLQAGNFERVMKIMVVR